MALGLPQWTTRVDKILQQVEPGDLICFHRKVFVHHSVYVGSGRAVHHHLGPADGEIIEATVEYLAKGDLMRARKVRDSAFSPQEVVRRARSQIGPRPYSLHERNCEHFTRWVYYDREASAQIERLTGPELQLLKVVRPKGRPPDSCEQQQQQQQQQEQQEQQEADEGEEAEVDKFVFVPPRPQKYRHTTNPARLAWNHARSCACVWAVQAALKMAALPYRRCGEQADGLRRLRRSLRTCGCGLRKQ